MYALTQADWSKLVISRDPSLYETHYDDDDWWSKSWGRLSTNSTYNDNRVSEPLDDHDMESLISLVTDNPSAVAELLSKLGFSPDLLIDEANIDYGNYLNDYASRRYM